MTQNLIAPMGAWQTPPGLCDDVSTKYHTIETQALNILRDNGFMFPQQLDWIAKHPQGDWFILEVKYKSRLFYPPPYWGLVPRNSYNFG